MKFLIIIVKKIMVKNSLTFKIEPTVTKSALFDKCFLELSCKYHIDEIVLGDVLH